MPPLPLDPVNLPIRGLRGCLVLLLMLLASCRRLLLLLLLLSVTGRCSVPANMLSGYGSSELRLGFPPDSPIYCFNAADPSKDLLLPCGRSKTLKEGSGAGLISSNAFPEDFRRANPFGNLIGIERERRRKRNKKGGGKGPQLCFGIERGKRLRNRRVYPRREPRNRNETIPNFECDGLSGEAR